MGHPATGQQLVLKVLRETGEPMNARDISQITSLNRQTALNVLLRLETLGSVRRVAPGLFVVRNDNVAAMVAKFLSSPMGTPL